MKNQALNLLKRCAFVIATFTLLIPAYTVQAAPVTNGQLAVLYKENASPTELRLYSADGSTLEDTLEVADSPSDTVTSFAWSPDGAKIAFVKNGDVYVMNEDGSDEHQLTEVYDETDIRNDVYKNASGITWSPDGNMIAFVTQWKLFLVNVDGSQVMPINDFTSYTDVKWTKNNRLAISYLAPNYISPQSPEPKVYVRSLKADSSYATTSTEFSDRKDLNISSDGQTVVFVAWDSVTSPKIYTAINGGAAQLVPNQDGNLPSKPSLSPDGSKLVYITRTNLGPFTNRLYIQNTGDSTSPVAITAPAGATFANPAWQPVGDTLMPMTYDDMYRLRNKTNGFRMITDNVDEKNSRTGGQGYWEVESRPFTSYPWNEPGTVPMYRFDQVATGNQLLTINLTEARNVVNTSGYWGYKGVVGFARETPDATTMPVYRLTHRHTGQMHFTADPNEVGVMLQTPNTWWFEGTAFYMPKDASYSDKNVYRMTNYNTGERIFTTNAIEVFVAQQNYPGWKYEGIAFKAAGAGDPNTTPIYRLTNYYKRERLFTHSAIEANYAQQHYPGWVNEGEVFKAYATQEPSTTPVYRLVNWAYGGRLFTTSLAEAQFAVAHYPGWVNEGIAFYAKQ